MTEYLTLFKLTQAFPDADTARAYLEAKRWPNGAACPHCGGANPYKLEPKAGSQTRKGVWKCRACRKQFTVTVGTVMEDSHIPLNKWLIAIHLMCSSKKGISAHQLHRDLEMSYKSAWFMCHRVRYAMSQPPLAEKLSGIVEVDETYVGGKRKNMHAVKRLKFSGRGTSGKAAVVTLVERNGRVRSFANERVTGENLKDIIRKHVASSATIMTDEASAYEGLDAEFAGHETVAHGAGEYARENAHINTAEGYFSLLKRGVVGTFHHISQQHLHRYCAEFDFRYNGRKLKDGQRTVLAIKATEGKRLMYKKRKDGD